MRKLVRILTAAALAAATITVGSPAQATTDCDVPPATFTNTGPADVFYVQAHDGVAVVALETGESHQFWVGAPAAQWAVWTSTSDVWETAQPDVLVASGVFCDPAVVVGEPLVVEPTVVPKVDDSGLVVVFEVADVPFLMPAGIWWF